MNRDIPKPKDDLELHDGTDDESPPGRDKPVSSNVTGRVKFDDRGNAVWEWAVSTGAFGEDVSSKRLKKLENAALSITEDPAPRAAAAAASTVVKENRKGVTQGYSPYDSGLLVKAEAEARRAKKKDLRRLSEWLKLREQAKRNKPDE